MTCFPLAGLNPNMNVNNMDITGGLSVKDTSQSQSRLPQWTHPNSMDNLSSAASSLDQNSSKHGMSHLISISVWLFETWVTLELYFFLMLLFSVSADKWLVQSSTFWDRLLGFFKISVVSFSNALKSLQLEHHTYRLFCWFHLVTFTAQNMEFK